MMRKTVPAIALLLFGFNAWAGSEGFVGKPKIGRAHV